ncbi:MAG: hypothetical protein Q7J11_00470 [Candidatus Roizmanbacteria bacterium]|nr:hypothetical protein [Candidatus Roizmanbacteria bacterium]
MYNWSVDIKRLKKDKQKYEIWKLIQSINYGLDDQRLSKKKLIKAWPVIKNKLDPYKKRALEYLIWGKQYSLPNNLNFWNLLN